MTKTPRPIINARADSDGDTTHVLLKGNQRYKSVEKAMDMADRGEISNAHAVRPSNVKDHLRTNPDGKTGNNLDAMVRRK
jgi:hypothetical protein